MTYILPAFGVALMFSGLIIRKRNRPRYTSGKPMDAQSVTYYGRGEAIFLVGLLCYVTDLLFVKG